MAMRINFLSRRVLMVFILGTLACSADARSKPSPSELYPGPWLEVTQQVREISHFKKSQRAMRRWGGNRHAIPASIFCTAPKTRGIGQAGSWSPRRIRCVVPADFSKASHYLTPTEVVTVAAPMSALGHKRTYATGMSALPPKADIRESDCCVSRARFNQPMKNVGGGADVEIFRTKEHGAPP